MCYKQFLTHPSTYVERERKEHMMSRLQAYQQPHQEGLALCHRVTLDSAAHWGVPARTPTVHRCPKGKALGGPTQASQRRPPTNDNTTRTSLKTNVLSSASADTHLESYMVAEPVREAGDLRRDVVKLRERTRCQRVDVETSRIIKKIAQRSGTSHPGEDHPGENQPGDRVHPGSAESVH